jgi:hypothetical protein
MRIDSEEAMTNGERTRTDRGNEDASADRKTVEGPLTVTIGAPSAGWAPLVIVPSVPGAPVSIHCSEVFCPFGSLAAWLRAIASGRLPAAVAIDQEGRYVTLRASAAHGGADRVCMEVLDGHWGDASDEPGLADPTQADAWRAAVPAPGDATMRCTLPRADLVRAFARALARWLHEDYSPRSWNGHGGDLRDLDLSGVRWALPPELASALDRWRRRPTR